MNSRDRAALDAAISQLVSLGGGLTVDDFRPDQMREGARRAARIRSFMIVWGMAFLSLAFSVLYFATDVYLDANGVNQRSRLLDDSARSILYGALWAVALGGLGAVTSVFLSVLKFIPQSIKIDDEFEVNGRIVLGVLFSFVVGLTFLPANLSDFFKSLHEPGGLRQSIALFAPFLVGYSLPLVLGLLDKTVTALQLVIGIEDRRLDVGSDQVRVSKFRRRN